jgi:hypothetical protein
MSSLDSWLMSDLEVWVTLAGLAGVALIFVPALGAPAWAERRGNPKLVIVACLIAAALGGLAWYAVPASSNAASLVAVADRS